MKLSVRRVIHAGETIAIEAVVTGTHRGDFNGQAATKTMVGYDSLRILRELRG